MQIFSENPYRLASTVGVNNFQLAFIVEGSGTPNSALVGWSGKSRPPAYAVQVLEGVKYSKQYNTLTYSTTQSKEQQKQNIGLPHAQKLITTLSKCSMFVDPFTVQKHSHLLFRNMEIYPS